MGKSVFEGVGQMHQRIELHNARGALDGVPGSHEGVGNVAATGRLFQREQVCVYGLHLRFQLDAEEVEQGELAVHSMASRRRRVRSSGLSCVTVALRHV